MGGPLAILVIVLLIAVLSGRVAMTDAIKIVVTVLTLSAVGLFILYVPSSLYESIRGKDAPTWLTGVTAVMALALALGGHLYLSLNPPAWRRRRD
jgi:hypothetical protein